MNSQHAVKSKVVGLEPLLARLERLKKKVQKQIVRKAVGKGGQVILKESKSRVAVGETGMLKKSLGQKVAVEKKQGRAVAVVGPRTGWKRERKTGLRVRTAIGKRFEAAGGVKPTLYAHLVEKGRKSGPPMRPQPFMRPALDTAKTAAVAAMTTVIQEGIATA